MSVCSQRDRETAKTHANNCCAVRPLVRRRHFLSPFSASFSFAFFLLVPSLHPTRFIPLGRRT